MIEIKNVYKTFGETTALSNLSVTINDSELFGFIGPDGAGKTTLFRLITTLLVPDSGTITLMGNDIVKDYREIRKKVGYMPGRFSLYQDLTVEENLEFYATVFGTTVKENYHLIEEIYSHIEPYKKRPAGKLSGGMKQKLALCCALIHSPEIIILDEPTTGVDAVSRTEFWEVLQKLKKENITIVVSTPYMDEASRCDRVSLIQSGKIMVTDEPGKLATASGKRIFAVTASRKFQLIKLLRTFSSVDSVDAFGDSIHITFTDNKTDDGLADFLHEGGIKDLSIKEIEPGIEDTFLHLMKREI